MILFVLHSPAGSIHAKAVDMDGFLWIEIHFLETKRRDQPSFVESERLSVDVSLFRTTVAVWAQRDQVLEAMLAALSPRNNVVNIDIDVPTGMNRTAVASLKEDLPPEVSWNRWSLGQDAFRSDASLPGHQHIAADSCQSRRYYARLEVTQKGSIGLLFDSLAPRRLLLMRHGVAREGGLGADAGPGGCAPRVPREVNPADPNPPCRTRAGPFRLGVGRGFDVASAFGAIAALEFPFF